jgi:hypothetical protein
VSSDTSSFSVVNLKSNLRTDLSALNVEEAGNVSCGQTLENEEDLLDVMSTCVEDREEQHGVSDLLVEPHVLVERCPSSLRS